jgi:hypothetical protein
MELNVRGKEENRVTSHPHVVLTPMYISDRSPIPPTFAPSNTRTMVFLGDGVSCKRTFMERNSVWKTFQCIERNRKCTDLGTDDLTAGWTISDETLREDRE